MSWSNKAAKYDFFNEKKIKSGDISIIDLWSISDRLGLHSESYSLEEANILFEDIKKAQDHIHIEYYIFNSGRIGNRLILLLCEKAEEGVKVRVSYDYVASRLSSKAVKKMKSCGIEIYPFMPVWFPNLTRKLNYRNHRKMAIIDGNIGFIL